MKIVSFIGLALLAVGGCRAVESGSRGDGSESDGAASLETERVIAEAAATRPALKTEITAADIARYRLERPRLLLSKSDVQRVRIDYPGHSRYIEKRCSEARGAALPEDAPVTKPTGQAPAYRSSWSAISPEIVLAEVCAVAFQLSGKTEFKNESIRRLDHFLAWDEQGVSSLDSNDEIAMTMLASGVRSFDILYDEISVDVRERLETHLRSRTASAYTRLTQSLDYQSNPRISHANRLLGFLGESALAFIDEWEEAPRYLEYVVRMFDTVYPAWAADDGGWNEGPTYWTYYMGHALYFLLPLRDVTGVDLLAKPFFRNTGYYKLYANAPGSGYSPFGDGEHQPPPRRAGEVMLILGSIIGVDDFVWYAGELGSTGGYQSVALGVPRRALNTRTEGDLPQRRYFEGAGLVAWHSDIRNSAADIGLLFRSSPMGAQSHAHPDQNAFAIEAGGKPLAIASGYYPWYGSPHHTQWQHESISSNTITVDGGQGQFWGAKAPGAGIVSYGEQGGIAYAAGDASRTYGGLDNFVRQIIQLAPSLFVIHDQLHAKQPRTFEWNLHSPNEMIVDVAGNTITLKNDEAAATFWLRSSVPVGYQQTDAFSVAPEDGSRNQWHLMASTDSKVEQATFTALVAVGARGPVDPTPQVVTTSADGQTTIDIRSGSSRYVVLFSDAPDRRLLTYDNLTATGDVAVWAISQRDTTFFVTNLEPLN